MVAPGVVLAGGAMSKGWFQVALLIPWSHQVLRTEPSGPAQNTSTCSCSLAAAATAVPGAALPAGPMSKTAFQ